MTNALAETKYDQAIAAWDKVLKEFVDAQGRTDFKTLATKRDEIDFVVSIIANFGPKSNPEYFDSDEKILAYHINTYNVLAMHGVIEEGIPEAFNSFFKRAGFFRFRKVTLDGETTNLYDYENKVIRKFNEPRIHFALNCMVKDCPRLPQTAFRPETLEAQLEDAAREFFSKDVHFFRNEKKSEVWVSEILDFYTEDFAKSGKRNDLIPYLNRYVAPPVPGDWRVKFIDYDWTVNQQPR
ncbi:MAG: DUF547 domain-containing protein [Gammaproteobacteria bacterium]